MLDAVSSGAEEVLTESSFETDKTDGTDGTATNAILAANSGTASAACIGGAAPFIFMVAALALNLKEKKVAVLKEKKEEQIPQISG